MIQRNQDVRNILRSTRLGSTMCELTAQYHTIWMGDLNYRVDRHTRAEAVALIDAGQLEALAQHDQLRGEMASARAFHGFVEAGDIAAFAPTYKLLIPSTLRLGGSHALSLGRHSMSHSARIGPAALTQAGRRAYAAEKNRVPAW